MQRLWLDEFAPTSLSELRESRLDSENQLDLIAAKSGSADADVPHMIIHGQSGSGKTLRARLLLQAIYGPGVLNSCRTDSLFLDNGKTEYKVYGSAYHTEINAGDLGLKDKQFVQQMIKELASYTSAASLTAQKSSCRVFVIHEAHMLSLAAQAALRRTMERYSQTSRIFLLTERLSSLIAPLRSRCICVAVLAPTISEISTVLRDVVSKAGAQFKNPQVIDQIAAVADGNLRRALVMCQQAHRKGGSQPVLLAWQKGVKNIVSCILEKPSVAGTLECRSDVQCNHVYNLESQYFLECIARGVLQSPRLSFVQKATIAEAAAYFSETMAGGNKESFHIEGFIAQASRIVEAG